VVLESVIHTIAWAYVKHAATGWEGVGSKLVSDPFISYGTVAAVGMVIIVIISPSPTRHAFYETFLNVHIILAFVSIIAIYLHCHISKLPQASYVLAVILLWLAERIARVVRIVYFNYSRKGWTTASIESLPGDASRVTLHLPKYVNIKPGTHAYLRFQSLNIWESHPFSIAWVEHRSPTPLTTEKELEAQGPASIDTSNTTTDVSFVIHAQTGVTRRLWNKANLSVGRSLTLRAAIEGPYAGHHSLDSYGHAILIAGSSGITHQLGYLRHLIQGFQNGTVVTRKILLIWIIRDAEHLAWVEPWMNQILAMPSRRSILNVKLFITRPKNPREIISPSTTVQMSPGRPNLTHLIQEEVRNQIGAMCVTVCGPGGLADNVREAVRDVQQEGTVDFIEESFTW
jgi:predicted ferric reductase